MIFADEQSGEQRRGVRPAQPAAQATGRRVFERAHGELLRAQIGQPPRRGVRRVQTHADGQGVDEQSGRVRGSGDMAVSPGAHRAERHVVRAGIESEGERPRTLDAGANRNAERFRSRTQAASGFG